MLIHIPNVLSPEEVRYCRDQLETAQWTDGRVTAGEQSAKAKLNLQIPQDSDVCRELGEIVLRALGRNPTFNSA
ncbi:MAG: PKHD-type hydroxylase, partial [Gluconobacter sp.]